MKKKSIRGLSDATLCSLARRVALRRYGYRCIVCGQEGDLEGHHVIHRGVRVLRYDPDNIVPVCKYQVAPDVRHGESCHQWADTLEGREYVRSFLGEDVWAKLCEKEHVLLRDELAADGLTRA